MRKLKRTAGLLIVFAFTNSLWAQEKVCRDILNVASDPAQIARRAFVHEFKPAIRAMLKSYSAGVIEAQLLTSIVHRVHFIPDPVKESFLPHWLNPKREKSVGVEKDYVLLLRQSLELSGETILLFDPDTKQRLGVLPTGRYEFSDGRVLYAWWSYPDGHQYKWLPHKAALQKLIERL